MTGPRRAECVIAGGGPAGLMAGFLMARAGVETVVLEKHGDFLRDFRGDTVHPSSLEIFNDLGLLDRFLQRPHQRLPRVAVRFGNDIYPVADFSALKVAAPFIAFMPQWEFLDFLADEAQKLPNFTLMMETQATSLRIDASGRVTGVLAEGKSGSFEIEAALTIAADGRASVLRAQSGLPMRVIGAPIDVLWFAVPREDAESERSLLNAGSASVVISIDRGDYWQCAYVIEKDGLVSRKALGLDRLKDDIAAAAPHLHTAIRHLTSWDQVKLLSVAIDRLDRWARPGFLAIGDAAHAMSPIGGVGVNLAVQDAVAAANLLAGKLAANSLQDADLDLVQKRRAFPTRLIQFVQAEAQDRILIPILSGKRTTTRPPLALRIVARLKFLQRLTGRLLGLGPRPERVLAP